jgi:UDPglucose 6-dehydrogenase
MKIGFLGLGKLGLPCAVATDAKGHQVVGYDVNPNITSDKHPKDLLYTQEADETGKGTIKPMLEQSNLKIVNTIQEVVEHSEIIFVAIQTPHKECFEGHVPIPEQREDFNYEWLINCVKSLSEVLDKMNVKKIVTIISTVLPGTLRKYIFPILSKNISLCYNPYFIAMGSVVYDFYNPEFILLGHIDDDAEKKVKEFYKTITNAEVFSTTLENAEMIKVSYNTFITTKIVIANNVMEMCHNLPNTDVDVVMSALKKGNRRLTSSAYLNGGMGDGGGCHPRDNIAMSWLSNNIGIDMNYYDFIMKKRENQTEFLANLIIDKHKETNLPICILGTAFKPNTNIETGSPAVLLKHILVQRGYVVETYDPHMCKDNTEYNLSDKLYFIGCKHDIFTTYLFTSGSYIIDVNRYITHNQGTVNITYVGVGNKL